MFLENPDLAYALRADPEIGNIRDTFVLNQLQNAGLETSSPSAGDFMIGELTLEVGGKNKASSQVSHLDKYLIVADNIEYSIGNKVPIWLLGFLY
ncbi:MAG: hypothetical protein ACK5MG_05715 [Bacteroidales bacterium]